MMFLEDGFSNLMKKLENLESLTIEKLLLDTFGGPIHLT